MPVLLLCVLAPLCISLSPLLDVAVFTVYLRKLPSPLAATFLPTVIRILAATAAGPNDYSFLALLGTTVLEKLRNRWSPVPFFLSLSERSTTIFSKGRNVSLEDGGNAGRSSGPVARKFILLCWSDQRMIDDALDCSDLSQRFAHWPYWLPLKLKISRFSSIHRIHKIVQVKRKYWILGILQVLVKM